MSRKSTASKSRAKPSSLKASSSGVSRSSSMSPTTRERVGKYELGGLVHAWDDDQLIRGRLREGLALFLDFDKESAKSVERTVDINTQNIKCNLPVLLPITKLMQENNMLMPNIDRLIQVVDQVYTISKNPRSLEHCYQMAWVCRRLLVCGKAYCYRPAPPEEPRLKSNMFSLRLKN